VNLRQLRSLCEIVDRGLRISDAAGALHRSQPSVTRQIQELEKELGIDIFLRRRNRILEITPQGQEILRIARRMLLDADNLQKVGAEFAEVGQGNLVVATTHTQARYTLPTVIRAFKQAYPRVNLSLRQGTPTQCCELVAGNRVDFAICTEVEEAFEGVLQVPCYRLNRSVITPPRHPLLRVKPLTLEAIARYPVITYEQGFSARGIVNKAFSDHGLKPNVVLSAIDADVSKSYVHSGLGIAILATIGFDAARDTHLRRIDARHLFKPSRLNIVVRHNHYLRGYALAFMRLFAPRLSTADLEGLLSGRVPLARQPSLPEL